MPDIVVETTGKVVTVTIDRPPVNPLTLATYEEIADTFDAMALAELIASKAPLGLRMGKAALNETEFLPVEEGYAVEQRYSTRLMATEDAREATRAVVEKRKPVFTGR